MAETRTQQVLVYIGTYTEDPQEGIYHFRLDTATGALEPAGQTPAVPNPFFLVIDAVGRHLYATNAVDDLDGQPGGAISAFAIDPASGALRFLNRQPASGKLPCYLALDRSGRHLLTGNYNSGSVAVLPIGPDGRLGPASCAIQHQGSSVHPQRQEGPHVHSIVLDPAQRFAFAADLGIDKVMAYRFDAASGQLTALDPPWVGVQAGAGPRHLRFHPNGRFAYLLNELDGTFTVFSYDAGRGRLAAVQTVSTLPAGFAGENFAADVQILPSGRFLWGSNRGHDSIALFAVDPQSGRLTAAGHQPCGGRWPWNLGIDPTTSFLLASNYQSDCVSVLRIDRDSGQLTPTGHQARVPKPVNAAFLLG